MFFALNCAVLLGLRETVVDFSYPYYIESTNIVTRAPGPMSQALAVFSPFTNTVECKLIKTSKSSN